jgi:hypothetical protein
MLTALLWARDRFRSSRPHLLRDISMAFRRLPERITSGN